MKQACAVVLLLAGCHDSSSPSLAAKRAAPVGFRCVANQTEGICYRDRRILECDIRGAFSFDAICREIDPPAERAP